MPYVSPVKPKDKMKNIAKPKKTGVVNNVEEVKPKLVAKVPPGLQGKGGMPPGQLKKALPDERGQVQPKMGIVSPINPKLGIDVGGPVRIPYGDDTGGMPRGPKMRPPQGMDEDRQKWLIGLLDQLGGGKIPQLGGGGVPSPISGGFTPSPELDQQDPTIQAMMGAMRSMRGGQPPPIQPQAPEPWMPQGYPTQSGPPMMGMGPQGPMGNPGAQIPFQGFAPGQDHDYSQLLQQIMGGLGGGGMRPMIPPGLQGRGGGMRPMIPRGYQSGPPSQPRDFWQGMDPRQFAGR